MTVQQQTWTVFPRGSEVPDAAPDELTVHDPSRRGEVVGRAHSATPADVDAAIEEAAEAQRAWAALDLEERLARLDRIATRIEERSDELGEVLAREAGVLLVAAQREVRGSAAHYRLVAPHARALLVPEEHSDDSGTVRVLRRPFGVVGCIVPWNAPAGLTAQKVAPALAVGNAVIVKPSPFAPLAVTAALELARQELPPGLLQVVNGEGDVGAALIAHPRIAKISFTGGGPTARSIMRSAAERLASVHFELGGNDPAIVLDDADAESTAEGIVRSAFNRSGQVCYAVKRVYVPESRAEEFRDAIARHAGALVVGDPLDARTTMGPVNNAGQFDRVRALRERTEADGRRVVDVGTRLDADAWDDGYFLQPALVLDAQQDDEVVRAEQFGPLLPIISYRDEDEALRLANDTEYGLAASVWSTDEDRAQAVAERIESGVAFVNAHALSPLTIREMPFGGVKQSGMGWENSPAGVAEYVQFHSVARPSAS